jgi:hypothetical protein
MIPQEGDARAIRRSLPPVAGGGLGWGHPSVNRHAARRPSASATNFASLKNSRLEQLYAELLVRIHPHSRH